MLTWERKFSPVEGPYHGINWEPRDVAIWQPDEESGEMKIVFQQKGVIFPDFYGDTAAKIIAQKYFRGYVNKVDGSFDPETREYDLVQLVDRVIDTTAGWAGFVCKTKEDAPEGWTVVEIVKFEDEEDEYYWLDGQCLNTKTGEVPKLLSEAQRKWTHVRWVTYKRPKRTMAKPAEVYWDSYESWDAWRNDMKWGMVHQYYWFNSPAQFNIGIDKHPQVHACFIVEVNDWMLGPDKEEPDGVGHPEDFQLDEHGLLAWQVKEGIIFSRGSGSGVNLSRIRSNKEFLSSGGKPTGPLSFARGCDTWASQIKSGGKTRRAAKMLEMDVDHPDIEDFVRVKAEEEKIAKVLGKAGYGTDMDSVSYDHVFHQNSNLSVRVSDAFMEAVDQRKTWPLISRSHHFLESRPKATSMIGTEGRVIGERNAYDLMQFLAQSCWDCGDPGMQFHDTMNAWNPVLNDGMFVGTNPCSEYVYLEGTACNLGSHNLLKYLTKKIVDDSNGAWVYHFDVAALSDMTRAFMVAHDCMVSNGRYPTKHIATMSDKHRTVGMGYCNLGAMLMHLQLPYDSRDARTIAGSIASTISSQCFLASIDMAQFLGSFEPMERNREHVARVLSSHLQNHETLPSLTQPGWYAVQQVGQQTWMSIVDHVMNGGGIRNGQVSLMAPTGTIGIAMDADTTGIEPEFSLSRWKQLAGGGTEVMINKSVAKVMENLGYSEEAIEDLGALVTDPSRPSIRTWKGWHEEQHVELFRTSVSPPEDQEFCLPWQSHVKMMAAVQPLISGAISKTINMPKAATVEDIYGAYLMAWTLGLKSIAIYRDGSKMTQAIQTGAEEDGPEDTASMKKTIGEMREQIEELVKCGNRRIPPNPLPALRNKFRIGNHKGYLHVGFYPDTWDVAEIFIELSKTGSTLNGFVDAVCILFSIGIQYGVPLESFAKQFEAMNFEPNGPVDHDAHIKRCWSIPDYIVRKVITLEEIAKKRKGLPTTQPLTAVAGDADIEIEGAVQVQPAAKKIETLDRACPKCGSLHVQIVGSCLQCLSCLHEEGTCYS